MAGRLVVVRHGKTVAHGTFVGRSDAALSDLGKEEALRAGDNLKHTGLNIDVAFTATSQRCIDTAQATLQRAGYDGNSAIKIGALVARDYGRFTGRCIDEEPQDWLSFTYRPPGGVRVQVQRPGCDMTRNC
ncbi:unnamed protein product [Effrenium voratum]|nr:unnamed protein product [Effrenium voratum]